MMKSNFITVLNHVGGDVRQHTLPSKFRNRVNTSEIEDWLWDNGYSLGNIEWMVHERPILLMAELVNPEVDEIPRCNRCECGDMDPNLCGSACIQNTN